MLDPLAALQARQDLVLLVVQFRRDDRVNRLADHLLGLVSEDPLSARVPGPDDTLQGLADDGVVGGGDDGRKMRGFELGQVPLRDVDQHVGRPGKAPLRVEERCRVGDIAEARSVRPLADQLDSLDRAPFAQSDRRGRFLGRHGLALRREDPPQDRPLVDADLRRAARHFEAGAVAEGDDALCVGRVDGDRHTLQRVAEAPFAFAGPLFSELGLRHVLREAAGPHEGSVMEIAARGDQHMPDGAVLCEKPRGVALECLPAREPLQDILDHRLIRMELGDMPPDILVPLVAEKLKLRLVGAQDRAVRCHQMEPDCNVLEEIV